MESQHERKEGDDFTTGRITPREEMRTSFLDLAPELRLKVYAHLFPTCNELGSHDSLRYDNQPCSNAIMRTCRVIYEEVRYELYAKKTGYAVVDGRFGSINLFGKKMFMNDIEYRNTEYFSALKYTSKLYLDIRVDHDSKRSICDAQDELFTILNCLIKGPHKLQALYVTIDISNYALTEKK
jgi:hypothetical protein